MGCSFYYLCSPHNKRNKHLFHVLPNRLVGWKVHILSSDHQFENQFIAIENLKFTISFLPVSYCHAAVLIAAGDTLVLYCQPLEGHHKKNNQTNTDKKEAPFRRLTSYMYLWRIGKANLMTFILCSFSSPQLVHGRVPALKSIR